MHILKKAKFLIILLLPTVLISCRERAAGSGVTIPFVERILADTTSRSWSLVSDRVGAEGSIAVIGDFEGAAILSEKLLTADRFNNIDGRPAPDGLPDFAGEVISLLADFCGQPYEGYLAAGNADFLKELTVREFLLERDSVCLYGPFDHERTVSKSRAKAVVLSSPCMAAFGESDIDTLCKRAANSRIPLISTAGAMVRAASARHGADVNIGVWTTGNVAGSGVYEAVAARVAPSARCTVFSADSSASSAGRLAEFLGKYLASGAPAPIGAIFLDDPYPDPQAVGSALEQLRSTRDGHNAALRELLADDVEVILPWEAAADECFLALRKANAFTHKVAFPDAEACMTVPATQLPSSAYNEDGSLADSYKFNRAGDSSTESFALVRMRDSYLPEGALSFMETRTPNLFSLYVQ